jgi:hypothetical protein
MATEVSICNKALTSVGASTIISLDDNTTEAILCKAQYSDVRNAVLEEHNWTFATKWLDIPKLANPPLGEYRNAFPLPPEVIRVIFVGEDFDHPDQWQLEQDMIRKDGDTCKCQVLIRETNPNRYSPLFLEALSARLAMEFSLPLTNSATFYDRLANIYEEKMAKAKNNDSAQGRARKIKSSWLQSARAGGGSAGPYV